MPRPLRCIEPNGIYHVTSRGNRRQDIVLLPRDCLSFKKLLADTVSKYELVLIAWCLMDNHLHLLVRVPHANLSAAMQWFKGTYALRFNLRHGYQDHLFGGRFKARHVRTDSGLVAAGEYVLANPSDAGMVELPEEWPWSSAAGSVGLTVQHPFVDDSLLLAQYGADRERAQLVLRRRLHNRRDELVPAIHRTDASFSDVAAVHTSAGLTLGFGARSGPPTRASDPDAWPPSASSPS